MSHELPPAMGHGYQPGEAERGINFRLIYLALAATLGISILFALLVIPLVFGLRDARVRAEQTPALEQERTLARPAGPLLQAHPTEDLRLLRARDAELLESYGWSDQAAGTARIPVEQAIELVLRDGVGAPPAPAPASARKR